MNQKQKDLLCKMVDGASTKTQKQLSLHFSVAAWNEIRHRYNKSIEDHVLKILPKSLITQYLDMRKIAEKIKSLEEEQCKKWNKLTEKIESFSKQEQQKKDAAVDKLSQAASQAIIDIQFVESADEVKRILASIPSLDQLI